MKVEHIYTVPVYFKIRFNTGHEDTQLYRRIIIGEDEYLARSLQCMVPTYSDASFDSRAETTKYHLAGRCTGFCVDEKDDAILK